MSQILLLPVAAQPNWVRLPHDTTHAALPRHREPAAPPALPQRAAAWLLAVPMTVATLAGIALTIAPPPV